MKANLFLLAFGIVKGYLATAHVDYEIEMIADVVNTLHGPKSVVAGVCWTLQRKTTIAARFGKLENPATIHFANINSFAHYLNMKSNIIFVMDNSCNFAKKLVEQANAVHGFSVPSRWIFLENSLLENHILTDALEMLNILPNSEVAVAFLNNNNSYELEFVYKIGQGRHLRREPFGFWHHKHRFQKTESHITPPPIRRLDLEGLIIPISYVATNNQSITELENRENGLVDTVTKVCYHTTNYLYDYVNASRRYIFTNTWGYNNNGTWNGMTGYLIRGEAEIAGSPLFLTPERLTYIDYISQGTPTLSKFVFQQPNLSYENNLFLLSFRTAVWYSCIALIVLLFLVLFIVALWERKKGDVDFEKKFYNGILSASFGDILVMILGAACQQGSVVELKGVSGRLVMLVLFLAVMFLYTSYSANIVALLQSSSTQIQTLEHLLNSKIKCGVHDNVFNRHYFAAATEPVRKALYLKKVAPPGAAPRFMGMEEGVRLLQKGLFAFHMETGVGYQYVAKYLDESQKCRLQEIQFLQMNSPWIGVRKNMPYKEMLTIGMRRINEHGLQSRENLLFYENKPKCTGRGASFMSVSMVDCYPALLVLIYGIIAAVLVLAIEILTHRRKDVLKKIECFRRGHRNHIRSREFYE